ncbi:MAG TPA: hypothetical protein PLF01_06390 [Alphaproteobacteria bacterium]|nr:hypothetical protein [Alphaproteobacteria bacterium]
MKKQLLLITTGLLTLSACATIINHQSQKITMRTPGATNARCIIENEDMKYIAYTDDTIEIMKSPHDLVIRCQAPGNREQTVLLKREVNDWVFLNVANGFVPGAAYDYFSRGAFEYPDVFTVSFVGMPIQPYELPEHYNTDLKDNNSYNSIEYMGPTEKLTNKTHGEEPYVLKKKESMYGSSGDYGAESSAPALDDIHRQYNPSVSAYDPTEEDK